MTTEEVAVITHPGPNRRQPMALPGPTKMLPTLLRIAPNATGRMVANI